MNDRVNKTSICSIVFLDIIDYSKKSDSDQIDVKVKFNDLISSSLKSVAQNDRIILDTGDGVAIALMGSPEDAMFVALTIRDGIFKSNVNNSIPLYVRFGINLGPVRTVSDINNQPNIIGDGINVAQRIMSFAEPNQILVSRSYYEVTSRLTLEFSEMFAYSGVKHDKHVREHEIYSVRSHVGQEVNTSQPQAPKDARRSTDQLALKNKVNWKYAAPGLFAVVALLGFAKLMPMQFEAVTPAVVFKSEAKVNLAESNKPVKVASEMSQEYIATRTEPSNSAHTVAKQIERKKPVESTVAVNATHKAKSGMEVFANSFKQGQKSECSQAQISMNQCH
ncbi:MAG TPA: adenylate/guanylate cyclase domain-containing protein [Methylotenera sp.]|nr:adenylate/guanylate cyclase domain-containing protein [Methylotenera sp.]